MDKFIRVILLILTSELMMNFIMTGKAKMARLINR